MVNILVLQQQTKLFRTLKTIVKYRKHPSITATNQAFPNIKNNCQIS